MHYMLCSLGTLLVIVLFSIPRLFGSCNEEPPDPAFIHSELPRTVLTSDGREESVASTSEANRPHSISQIAEVEIDFQREDWHEFVCGVMGRVDAFDTMKSVLLEDYFM